MEKHYGVFKVCYKISAGIEDELNFLTRNAVNGTIHDFSCWGKARSHVYTNRLCFELKSELQGIKRQIAADAALSRGYEYKSKAFIHECDADGWFVPTKTDLARAGL